MKPASLEADSIKAFVEGHIEAVAFVANPKLHVARNAFPVVEKSALIRRAGREECQFLAGEVDHQDAGASEAAAGHI